MASEPVVIARIAALPFDRLEDLGSTELAPEVESLLALREEIEATASRLEASLFTAAGPPEALAPVGNGGSTAVASPPWRTLALHARRAVHQRRRSVLLEAAEEFRSPDPSMATSLNGFVNLLDRFDAALARHRERHEAAVAHSSELLLTAACTSVLDEGIRLVSGSLADKVQDLREIPPKRWRHRERHTALKLAAYFARSASKTSPHGVFCATALAALGDEADCRGQNTIASRDALLAVGEIRKITACLAVDPDLAPIVVPRPNPTLREENGHWIFWRPASPRNPNDDEARSRVRAHPVARALLDLCAPGRTLSELVAEAARVTSIATADLQPFARQMVESGLLIGEVEIPWSERRPLRWLAQGASAIGCTSPWVGEASAVERAVDTYDEPGTDRRAALRQISKSAERLPHHRPLGHDELLRVDVASALRLTLPRRVIGELEQFLAWYSRLNAAFYPRARAIEGHARRFLAVHPPDTDVPLLDLYHGVFEPREASRPSAFPSPSGSDERADQARQTFVRVRERMAAEALEADREGRDEVALDEWDWRSILGESPEPPWSCGALFQIAATGTEAIDAGDYRLILNGLYAGGGLAMARLAHLHAGDGPVEEGPIAREIRAGWSWLERDDAVVAEVSYMHGGRTANAGLRPSLFRYEIELPGDRATPSREVIPLTELVVRFDSASRRFRLIWRGRGLDVMPVIASGISPEGFIAFLVAVGQQDLQPLALFPGFHVEGIPRWPRFRFGQVVLFRRRWVFPVCETPMAAALGPMDSRRAFDAACWRRIHGLPRHLFAHTNAEPKPFYVDLESPWLLERLVRELSEHPETDLHLTEMLPGPDELWVRDARGRYASEFLVHLGNLPERSRS